MSDDATKAGSSDTPIIVPDLRSDRLVIDTATNPVGLTIRTDPQAPTSAEDAAWLLEYANDMDVIGRPVEDRLRAIASRLVALAERLAAAERDGDERVRQVQNAGNGLYLAILKVLTPAFPEGSRDLEWDVLPGAVRQVLKRATAAEAALATRTAEGEALR